MTAKSFFSSLIKKVVLPALIIAAAGYFFVYMKNSKPPVPAEPIAEKAWGVATHVVELVDAAPELALYGAVEASDSVELSATVSAYVDNVNVAKGDTVKAGQSLITLDDRELKLTLAQRQASILDTNARIASEKNSHATSIKAFAVEQKLQDLNLKNLARQEELVDNNMTPASRLEDASKSQYCRTTNAPATNNNCHQKPAA